jgi:hypothetical protein
MGAFLRIQIVPFMNFMLPPLKPAASTIVELGIRGTVFLVLVFGSACLIARGQDEAKGQEEAGDYSEDVRRELGVNPLKQVPLVMLYRMDLGKNFDGVLDAEEIPDAQDADLFVEQVAEEARFDTALPINLAALAGAWHSNALPHTGVPPELVIMPDPTNPDAGGDAPADGQTSVGGEIL